MRFQSVCVLAAAALFCLPLGSWAQDPHATLAQVPEGQFVVTYQDSELTIKARNAPLIDVLREVCNQIGAVVDLPSGANEPIITVIGPGPAREMLFSLLSNSRLDYAVLGSASDPSALGRVMVFPRTNNSNALGPAPQIKVSQGQGASADTSAGTGTRTTRENSGLAQMKELLSAAKADVAGGAAIDGQGGNEDGGNADLADSPQEVDLANALQQVEAQINAIGNPAAAAPSTNSASTGQQAAGAVPPNPIGLPRRRRR